MDRNKLTNSIEFGKTLKEKPDLEYRKLRDNYDSFLTQPLELYQFIPCKKVDGVWVVLEEPKGEKCCGGIQNDCDCRGELQYDEELFKEYQQAKKRCLFDGFKFLFKDDFKTIYKYMDCYLCFGNKNIYLGKEKDGRIYNKSILIKIEDLVKYNLQLTPTAIKQLGL